jgi:hypothetical protein
MNNSFFAHLQQLEMMAFFSGYPLLYAIIRFIAENRPAGTSIKTRLVSFLSYGYALVGTSYLGLQLRNLYPDYGIEHMHQPYLKAWAFLAIIFWIPSIAKKPVLSLLHSLVFFFFIIKDLFVQLFSSSGDKEWVRNDMKLFTVSLLLNSAAFLAIALISYVFVRFTSNKKSSGT